MRAGAAEARLNLRHKRAAAGARLEPRRRAHGDADRAARRPERRARRTGLEDIVAAVVLERAPLSRALYLEAEEQAALDRLCARARARECVSRGGSIARSHPRPRPLLTLSSIACASCREQSPWTPCREQNAPACASKSPRCWPGRGAAGKVGARRAPARGGGGSGQRKEAGNRSSNRVHRTESKRAMCGVPSTRTGTSSTTAVVAMGAEQASTTRGNANAAMAVIRISNGWDPRNPLSMELL